MFRSEYEAQVTERDPAGVATVWFRSERGNGLYWTSRDQLIAYDSREPVEPYRPTGHSSLGGYLVEHGRRSEFVVKLSPRSELVASYESLGGGRAGWVSAAEAHRAPQMHGLLLPLAKAPVRTADMTATQMRADSDTLGWPYDNRVVVPVDVRFEGATSTYARFSISGRATGSKEPGPGDEVRWVDVVEMEGVVDVDRTTGWVLSRDQTTIVTYRSILRAQVRDRGPGVAHVVNRRRLRVNGSRLP